MPFWKGVREGGYKTERLLIFIEVQALPKGTA
jgi:hypothetical protein